MISAPSVSAVTITGSPASLVAVGAALAVIGLGALLVQLFHYQQTLILLPVP